MDAEQWVRFDGGPEDGEYLPVALVDGRLPRVVHVEEQVEDRLVVHVYELMEYRPGAVKVIYRWDGEA
ncbi:hypothetical protein KGD82_16195 [Nocardiopsis eucommiae]|uniref:Uncharacterized protein n=1 Tax=Nocardiopsis eucommiae TaxID=2831970 RepID=A0A975QJC2_9ACTN|nr:hypothetical protein KGD82_16195 [Nocardiopsis eucommiae]